MKAIILLLAISATGCSDYDLMVRDAEHYCYMVSADHWPAYNENIKCDGEKK